MNFHVGQKVVCVDAETYCSCGCSPNLVHHAIYTVHSNCKILGYPGVLLVETAPTGWAHGYDADRFRPITEKKTDISVFTEILDRVNGRQKELVRVIGTRDQQSFRSPEST